MVDWEVCYCLLCNSFNSSWCLEFLKYNIVRIKSDSRLIFFFNKMSPSSQLQWVRKKRSSNAEVILASLPRCLCHVGTRARAVILGDASAGQASSGSVISLSHSSCTVSLPRLQPRFRQKVKTKMEKENKRMMHSLSSSRLVIIPLLNKLQLQQLNMHFNLGAQKQERTMLR